MIFIIMTIFLLSPIFISLLFVTIAAVAVAICGFYVKQRHSHHKNYCFDNSTLCLRISNAWRNVLESLFFLSFLSFAVSMRSCSVCVWYVVCVLISNWNGNAKCVNGLNCCHFCCVSFTSIGFRAKLKSNLNLIAFSLCSSIFCSYTTVCSHLLVNRM